MAGPLNLLSESLICSGHNPETYMRRAERYEREVAVSHS
jgi:hypothetical protein